MVDDYLDSLEKDLNFHVKNRNLKTIYIGGGTPTCLNEEQLEKLLQMLRYFSRFVKEYTIEINPETMSEAKYQLLAKYGINRASIGLQSTNDDILKFMNRKHNFNDVKKVIDKLHQYHIDNISIDLMYSIPNQTLKNFRDSLNEVCKLDIDHVSIYSLTIEENTVFGKKGYTPLDEDTEADMYEYIVDTLVKYGYHQYEIANFCLPGYESKHNLGYWHYDDYLALGPGSTSKYNHQRIEKTNNIKTYLNNSELIENIEILSNEDEAFENLMMSLRLEEGLNISVFKDKYGFNPLDYYSEAIKKNSNYLKVNDNHLICTDREILNHILVDFLD